MFIPLKMVLIGIDPYPYTNIYEMGGFHMISPSLAGFGLQRIE
jgi:hypothetical protein